MTTTTTFTGFQPEVPARRAFDLWRLIVPEKRRTEDHSHDVERWVRCMQEIANLLLFDVDQFPALADLDRCSDAVVEVMLSDLGNPFPVADFDLDAAARRKLLRNLVGLYKARGTAPGIEAAVRLLLGVEVTVVPHLATGWVLGVDELGEGPIAQIDCIQTEPYPFGVLPGPWTLSFAVDRGAPQQVVFVPGDFASPFAGTVDEVNAVINAQLVGARAYPINDGEPAMLTGGPGPYALSGGEALLLQVGTVTHEIVFQASDFAVPGAATIEEVVRVLQAAQVPGVSAQDMPVINTLGIYTFLRGSAAFLRSDPSAANTASSPLGIVPGSVAVGVDGVRISVYSEAAENGHIECTSAGTSVDYVLGFFGDPQSAAGGTVLAPSLQRTLYTFDLETVGAVDAATEAQIRQIAELWRCAREHVGTVRPAAVITWDGWQLGVSELSVDTELME